MIFLDFLKDLQIIKRILKSTFLVPTDHQAKDQRETFQDLLTIKRDLKKMFLKTKRNSLNVCQGPADHQRFLKKKVFY